MEFKDYYKIIGVQRNATQDEIKRSYRKLARKYHPDVSKEADAEARFKDVSEAYEVLRDPEKRLAYDQLGTVASGARDFRPPPGWDQGFEFHDSGGDEAQAREFSEFFESLFARRGRASRTEQAAHTGQADWHAHGNDTHARVEIDLEASYQGATRSLVLKHTVMGADGRPRLAERTLDVAIPKGIRAGQQIRLARQGGPAIGRGEPGDLYLEVAFAPHPLYWLQGRDVTLELPVAPWELALGAKVTAPTPAGPVELTIPAHSAPGRRLRLKGRGIPGQPPGDFYVVLRVALPPDDSPAAQAAWRELADRLAFNPRANLGSATP